MATMEKRVLLRIRPDLWDEFTETVRYLDETSASAVVRRLLETYVEERAIPLKQVRKLKHSVSVDAEAA